MFERKKKRTKMPNIKSESEYAKMLVDNAEWPTINNFFKMNLEKIP